MTHRLGTTENRGFAGPNPLGMPAKGGHHNVHNGKSGATVSLSPREGPFSILTGRTESLPKPRAQKNK